MNRGMKNHVMKAAACFLAGAIVVGGSSTAMAAGNGLAGIGNGISAEKAEHLENLTKKNDAENKAVKEDTEEIIEETAEETVEEIEETETEVMAETEETEEETVYETPIEELIDTVAVAKVNEDDGYINIRSDASTEADVVGKIYNNNAATILGESGDFYYVQSGNCVGYVAKYLMATGSDAEWIVETVGTSVAQVNAEGLMVRADASEDAEVIDMVAENDIVLLEEDLGGWAKVSTGSGVVGYVSADYVSYATYMPQAETLEEEAIRIAEEEAAYEAWLAAEEQAYLDALAAQQAEWEAQNQAWIDYLASQGYYADEAQAAADEAYAEQVYAEQEAANAQAVADEYAEMGDWDAYAEAQEYADQAQAAAEQEAYEAYEAQVEADAAADEQYYAAEQALVDAGIDPASVVEDDGVSSMRQQIVDYALQFVGNPYVWGGTSLTNGADCSGFVQSVFGDNGISLNRTAGQQSQGGTSVDLDSIQPGDLLFYSGSGDYGIGHVSMYIGDGKVVHASNSTDGIIVSDVNYRTPCSASNYIDG